MNDDTLILYYYKDGLSNRERQAVANALATNPSVAGRYRQLSEELGALDEPTPARPPADMVARWHESLDRAAIREAQESARPSIHSLSFLFGAAVTAALAIGVGLGFFLADDAPLPAETGVVASTAQAGTATLVRGLRVHLRESERGLAGLQTDGDERVSLIMNIVAQNRLFEKAAEQNDARHLARVLRAFELVLVELATEDIDPAEAEALRQRLIFELNVMLTKLSREASEESQSI